MSYFEYKISMVIMYSKNGEKKFLISYRLTSRLISIVEYLIFIPGD